MKTYLLSAAGVIFLSVIVSLVIPEGKLHKTIIFIMRMVCILVLIQPITGLFKIDSAQSEDYAYDYIAISKIYTENQSGLLKQLIDKEFGIDCECTVSVVHDEGNFKADSVKVQLNQEDYKLVDAIYEYLEKLNYINITVYAKSD